MSSRTVAAIFDAENSRFIAKVLQMAKATRDMSSQVSKAAVKNQQDWNRLGNSMIGAGALIGGGLVAITTAAVQWQSQFAGVAKTVSGTRDQIDALEGQLRGLARTMSASHEEIAQVAASAGQLGVATPDIAKFTRTMIMLGSATNLSADEAATSLAQLMVIMGTAPEKVDKLGAVLVRLGNNGASTESQIVELSQRLAGAGRAIGLTEAQLMGYASAIASTGMNVEAGGTAMSRTFITLDRIVNSSGPKLKALTQLMGEEWPQAFKTDASGAVQAFIEKLAEVQASGGSVTKVLDQLGIKSIYQTDVLRRLAGATNSAGESGKLLAEQLGYANDEMGKGTALLIEYQKRQQTDAAKVEIAWNNIRDSAIDAGSTLLPVLADGADQLARFAHSWQELPNPVKTGAVQLAGAAAAILLVGGGALKAVGAVSNLAASYKQLALTSPKAAAGLRSVGIAGLAIGAVTLALHAYGAAIDAAAEKTRTQAADISKGILEAFNQGQTYQLKFDIPLDVLPNFDQPGLIGGEGKRKITSLKDALDVAFSGKYDLSAWTAERATGTSPIKLVKEQLDQYDQGLADLAASGNSEAAAKGFKSIMDAAAAAQVPIEKVLPSFDAYRQQLDLVAEGLGLQGQISEQEYVDWMGGKIPAAVQKATMAANSSVNSLTDQQKALAGVAGSADDAAKAITNFHNKALALSGSTLGVNIAIQDAYKSFAEGGMKKGGGFSYKTESGQRNQGLTQGIASAANQNLEDLKAANAETVTIERATKKWRDKLADAYVYGGKNRDEAEALANIYVGLSEEDGPTFAAPGLTTTKKEAKELDDILHDFPDTAETQILAPGARPAKKDVDDFMTSVKGAPKEVQTEIRTIAELGGIDAARKAWKNWKPEPKPVAVKPYLTKSTLTVSVLAKVRYRMGSSGPQFSADGADGMLLERSGRHVVKAFEQGGFFKPSIGSQQPRIETNRGGGIRWSEWGAGPWEGFVSGHPAKRDRSRDITTEIVGRLGGSVEWRNADGGMRDYQQYSRTPADGRNVTVQVTTVNPVAEPASVTTNKALATAAAVGR